MYQPTTIGLAGERAVIVWLRQNGWTIKRWDTSAPGATDIEAQAQWKKLLVQVKAAIIPGIPSYLSLDEFRKIRLRAKIAKAEAWEARVKLFSNLNPVDMKWRQIS